MTEEELDELEDLVDEQEGDDLPSVGLPPALVAALAEAGVKTAADWKKLGEAKKLNWPRSLGEPPEGIAVNIVDD